MCHLYHSNLLCCNEDLRKLNECASTCFSYILTWIMIDIYIYIPVCQNMGLCLFRSYTYYNIHIHMYIYIYIYVCMNVKCK